MLTLDPVALAALQVGTSNAQAYAHNAGTIDRVVNGTGGAVLSRTGKSLLTLDEALRRIGYEAPVAFAPGIAVLRATQTVTSAGLTYHADPASLPFTTGSTFDGAQWMLVSNISAQDLASTSAGRGASLIGVRDDGGEYWREENAEAVFAEIGEYLRKRCNPAMSPWNAKFDGVTDDTAAINACFEYARVNNLTVELPPGTAIVSNLLFGTQATSTQSSAPPGMVGSSVGATTLKAKPGATGILLKAWSIAGTVWRGFSIDCNNQPGLVGIDTTWWPNLGPSLQCVFDSVWVNNYAATGWVADNNNDVSFFKCMVRSPATASQVAFRLRAPGGMVSMRDCTWAGGLLDISAQNVELTACWGHGIRFAAGATNVALLNACYMYGSAVTGAIISTDGFALGSKIQSLEMNGCWIDCTSGQSVINARIASGVRVNGCTFSPTGGTVYAELLGSNCVPDLGNGRVMIDLVNCRAEYNSTVSTALTIGFAAPQGFTVVRRGYDQAGLHVSDAGLVIRYTYSMPSLTGGDWYPLTGGGELASGLWALDILWSVSAPPYLVSAAALVRTLPTNSYQPGAAIQVNGDSHTHGGAMISIRPAAQTTGKPSDFDWSPSFSSSAGVLTVTATKIS